MNSDDKGSEGKAAARERKIQGRTEARHEFRE
jgi:hypothetical protein